MKAINLFSELHKPTQNIPVPVVGDELDYSLFYNSEQEKRVIERVSVSTNTSEQTVKIIYNMYFNTLFTLLVNSKKQEIFLGSYFKFLKLKNK